MEEEKYKQIRSALKTLPKVKARNDFEMKLFHRLRERESGKLVSRRQKKFGFGKDKEWVFNIFKPVYAPAIALATVLFIVVILYVYFNAVYREQIAEQESEKIAEQKDLTITEPSHRDISKHEIVLEEREMEMGKVDKDKSVEVPPAPSEYFAPAPEDVIKAVPEYEQKLQFESPRIESETTVDEKKSEGIDKTGKEAPVLKNDKMERKAVDKKTEEKNEEEKVISKEVNPSIIDGKVMGDSIKVDTIKPRNKDKKKETKTSPKNDSLKTPPEQNEQTQPEQNQQEQNKQEQKKENSKEN